MNTKQFDTLLAEREVWLGSKTHISIGMNGNIGLTVYYPLDGNVRGYALNATVEPAEISLKAFKQAIKQAREIIKQYREIMESPVYGVTIYI